MARLYKYATDSEKSGFFLYGMNDGGNIAIQVSPTGNALFRALNFTHGRHPHKQGERLPATLVTALFDAGLLYTGDDDPSTDIDSDAVDDLLSETGIQLTNDQRKDIKEFIETYSGSNWESLQTFADGLDIEIEQETNQTDENNEAVNHGQFQSIIDDVFSETDAGNTDERRDFPDSDAESIEGITLGETTHTQQLQFTGTDDEHYCFDITDSLGTLKITKEEYPTLRFDEDTVYRKEKRSQEGSLSSVSIGHADREIWTGVGNIANVCADIIVCPTGTSLTTGGQVARALRRQSGNELQASVRENAPAEVGETFLTYATGLQAGTIAYAVTDYDTAASTNSPTDEEIETIVEQVLDYGEQLDASTVALPLLGGGSAGRSENASAKTILNTIEKYDTGDITAIVIAHETAPPAFFKYQ